ncbi:MAG: hypothetical protein ACKOBK_06165, partial [Acidimicrobiaceae bacterium]
IICWSVKGDSGTTVVASTLALVHAEKSPRGALIVDLAGDVPAVLGLAEPSGIGIGEWFAQNENSSRMALQSIAIQATANLQLISRGSGQIVANANFAELAASLATFDLPVVVDAGCGVVQPELLARASSSLLITRPCYLSLRRAAQLNVAPTGVVLINEPGRALGKRDVESVIGAPVIAEITFDATISRAVDAGPVASRLPGILAQQLTVAARAASHFRASLGLHRADAKNSSKPRPSARSWSPVAVNCASNATANSNGSTQSENSPTSCALTTHLVELVEFWLVCQCLNATAYLNLKWMK